MGARPLKRAIDQYLIAPLAGMIVEKRFPEGEQFLFVRSDGKGIQVEFVDPDAGDGEPPICRLRGEVSSRSNLASGDPRAAGNAGGISDACEANTAISNEGWLAGMGDAQGAN